MTQKRQMIALLLSGALLCAAAPAHAVVNEYQTLELVRTYASEAEVQAVYPDLFPEFETMTQDDEWISLPNGKKLKTFETEPLTDQEKERVQNFDEANPVVKNGVMRRSSRDRTFLLEADVSVIMHELGYLREGDITTKKVTLYNANGEIVTELPLEAGEIVVSPPTRDFVAYNWAEFGGPPSIYFYSREGTLLQRQEIFEQAQVRFSQNGEFVQVFRDGTPIFYIFTRTGNLVYRGNSRETFPGMGSLDGIDGVFASEKADRMLLTTDLLMYLYTTQGKLLWTTPKRGYFVAECLFFSGQEKFVLQVSTSRAGDDRFDLRIHALTTGGLLEIMTGVAEIREVNGHLVIKKEGKFYEYQLQ